MSGTALNPSLFADVLDIVQPLDDQLQQVDVGDDLDGEGETIPNLEEGDSNVVAEMLKTVNNVSKGVSEGTHDEYRRCVLYWCPADNLIADTRDTLRDTCCFKAYSPVQGVPHTEETCSP
jgi:hypothetical protein